MEKISDFSTSIICNWFRESKGEANTTAGLCYFLNTSCKGFLYCGKECGPSRCPTKGHQIYMKGEHI